MARSILDTSVTTQDRKWNDPFLMYAHNYVPDDWYAALEFAMYVATQNPEYVPALTRIVAHFITDIAFDGDGDFDEQEDFKDYLLTSLGLFEALRQAGLEMGIYGNSFFRIHYPFRRYLIDRRHGYKQIQLASIPPQLVKYNYKNMTFNVPDPDASLGDKSWADRPRIDLEFSDRRVNQKEGIRLRALNPRRMRLAMNYVSGHMEYVYSFEEFFLAAIKRGDEIHQVLETPREMLEAISKDMDFKFNDGKIFHFKSPFISGISNNGWGVPPILLHYPTLHNLQTLRCINEAVARDYILPIRILSPSQSISGGGSDVMSATNLQIWKGAMQNIVAKKRQNPDMLFTAPFPVAYQEVGGNGRALAPVELIEATKATLFDSMGLPNELFKASLAAPEVPTALRLFETANIHIPRAFNRFVQWVVTEICDYLSTKRLHARLLAPKIADDMEKKNVLLQLASGGLISYTTAFKALNIDDPIEERRRRAKEDIRIQEIQEEENMKAERKATMGSGDQIVGAMAEAMAQQEGGGAPPPGGGGGAPPPPGAPVQQPSGAELTPLDIDQQADEQAQQMAQMDNSQRRQALNQLRATNPTLYALVKQKLEEMRAQGASQGRAQATAH